MVTLVVTKGSGSMDFYAERLAAKLDVPKVYTDVYQKIAKCFNISWLSHEALRAIKEDRHFIRRLNSLGGIIHLPNQHLGRYGRFLKMPYIITVHDLIRYLDLKGYGAYIHHPNLRDRFYLNLDYKGIKKAMRIIAPSQATKKDLMRHLKIPEESILVVYEGVDCEVFKPVPHRMINHPYILFVGSEHPRKNLSVLLRAFRELKQSGQFDDLKLVKVGGREADFRKQTLQTVRDLGLEKEVIFTDYIAEEELVSYYSAAECFIQPSLYEGFGLPLLEAMACGCPIIASNSSSLPEIAGDAVLFFSPHDSDELARLTRLVIIEPELRTQLVRKGFDRAKSFPWERTAQQTLQVYRSVEEELGQRWWKRRLDTRTSKKWV